MKGKILFLLCAFLLAWSCDDGDIITIELEFDDTYDYCEDNGLIFYKTKNDPAESLSFYIENLTIEDLRAFEDILMDVEETISPDEELSSTNIFSYRRYNETTVEGDVLFCSAIPPFVDIISNEEDNEGTVVFEVTVIEDDNDGIPWQDEDANEDEDNNPATNPTDTDNDGIPNYLDADDDGDNVLTIDEDLNEDGDNNPFTNPLNTDDDDDPNYLDPDDDNDGVLTRDEENQSADNNPLNDISNNDAGPDFLNFDIATTVPATEYRAHFISRTYTTKITIQNLFFGNVEYDNFPFGSKVEVETGIERETIFN